MASEAKRGKFVAVLTELGGSAARVGSTAVHVQSRLLIRDVFGGHRRSLLES